MLLSIYSNLRSIVTVAQVHISTRRIWSDGSVDTRDWVLANDADRRSLQPQQIWRRVRWKHIHTHIVYTTLQWQTMHTVYKNDEKASNTSHRSLFSKERSCPGWDLNPRRFVSCIPWTVCYSSPLVVCLFPGNWCTHSPFQWESRTHARRIPRQPRPVSATQTGSPRFPTWPPTMKTLSLPSTTRGAALSFSSLESTWASIKPFYLGQ